MPYQKFSTTPTKTIPTIPILDLDTGSQAPFTESLKPLEECKVFPATTAEDWKAIDAFISLSQAAREQAVAAMNLKEAVELEAGTPLMKEDVTMVNDLRAPTQPATTLPAASGGTSTILKTANIHKPTFPPGFNRTFSSSASISAPKESPVTNWASIEAYIREAATHRVMRHRLSRGELLTGPITKAELEELATALDRSFTGQPAALTTGEEAAAILDLPPPNSPQPPEPNNIHTVNPTLDGQFSASETIKIGQMTIKVLEDGSRTENRLSAVQITLPPGTKGGPMKVNGTHDEGFLVVKGKVRFTTRRYLDADHTTKAAKASRLEKKAAEAKALVDAEAAVHVADVGAISTFGDLLVPNKDMLEEILHAGARPVNVNHVMTSPEMENEGISVDVDVKWGGWVTVPIGARYTFNNPFQEEVEMLNIFTPGGNLEEMRRMSEEGRLAGMEQESSGEVVERPTKSVDDGGS